MKRDRHDWEERVRIKPPPVKVAQLKRQGYDTSALAERYGFSERYLNECVAVGEKMLRWRELAAARRAAKEAVPA